MGVHYQFLPAYLLLVMIGATFPCAVLSFVAIRSPSSSVSTAAQPRLHHYLPSVLPTPSATQRLYASSSSSKTAQSVLSSSGKTFYEILETTPEATKADLKRAYRTLAKMTHPDAIAKNPNSINDDKPTFEEIARAYEILSNPLEKLRYDRQLRALAFTNDVEQIVDSLSESNLFRKVVGPALRRGAITTRKGWSAAVGDESNIGGSERLLENVVKASREGWRDVDRLELYENSQELENEAQKRAEATGEIKQILSNVMATRISLALQTPDAPLTAQDALFMLDVINNPDSTVKENNDVVVETSPDVVKSSLFKRVVRSGATTSSSSPCTYDINLLSQLEEQLAKKKDENSKLSSQLNQTRIKLRKTRDGLAQAEEAEKRARKAFEDSIKHVSELREDLDEYEELETIETDVYRKTGSEEQQLGMEVRDRRETVRDGLKRRNEIQDATTRIAVQKGEKEDKSNDEDDEVQTSYSERMTKILEYTDEENNLIAEIGRLEQEAVRYRSKAEDLINRARTL